MKPRQPIGFRYIICDAAPGDGYGWHQYKRLVVRDSLEDIMKVYSALQETNMNFDSYIIELEPVWRQDGT